jgi:hypothetical protein
MEAAYANSVEKPVREGYLRDGDAELMCNIEVDLNIKDTIKLELVLFCGYDMGCFHLTPVRDQRLAFAKAVKNLWAPQKATDFLTNCEIINFQEERIG